MLLNGAWYKTKICCIRLVWAGTKTINFHFFSVSVPEAKSLDEDCRRTIYAGLLVQFVSAPTGNLYFLVLLSSEATFRSNLQKKNTGPVRFMIIYMP